MFPMKNVLTPFRCKLPVEGVLYPARVLLLLPKVTLATVLVVLVNTNVGSVRGCIVGLGFLPFQLSIVKQGRF